DSTLDYKYEIKIEHLLTADFLEDLYYDKRILDQLYEQVQKVLDEQRDAKLKQLETIITDKIMHTPYNSGNRKILIFSAFADTANYLYDCLSPELSKHKVNVACVTGSGNPRTTIKGLSEFNQVLRYFSPLSKMGE